MAEIHLADADLVVMRALVAKEIVSTTVPEQRQILYRILRAIDGVLTPQMAMDEMPRDLAFRVRQTQDPPAPEGKAEKKESAPTKNTGPRIDNE